MGVYTGQQAKYHTAPVLNFYPVAKSITCDLGTAASMFWEIAQIEVKAGEEAAFEAAVDKAVPLFKSSRGCKGMRLHRSVEHPSRYRLVVDWETVEDHTVHFRGSENFLEWRRLVGPHFASPPVVEHTHVVVVGF